MGSGDVAPESQAAREFILSGSEAIPFAPTSRGHLCVDDWLVGRCGVDAEEPVLRFIDLNRAVNAVPFAQRFQALMHGKLTPNGPPSRAPPKSSKTWFNKRRQ